MAEEGGTKEEKRRAHPYSCCNGGGGSSTSMESIEAMMVTYLGVSFAVFLGFLPNNALPYIASLQSRNRVLALRLFEAEEQLKQVRARQKEDGRANARAAEILAEHRSAWLEAERSLLDRIEEARAVESELRVRIESLERELLVAKSAAAAAGDGVNDGNEKRGIGEGKGEVIEEEEEGEEEGMFLYEEGGGEEGLELEEMAAMIYQRGLQMPLPAMDRHGLGPQNDTSFHDTNTNWFHLSNPSTNPIPNHNPWQVISSLVFIGRELTK